MGTAWQDDDLRFEYLTLAEIEQVAEMLAKPSVCAHVFFGPNTSEETQSYFTPMVTAMQESLRRAEPPAEHIFSIRRRRDEAFVGECALVPVAFGSGNYTIGYQLDEPYWRRGYGTRACEFLVWYGFAVLGAHRLSGDTLGSNAGSMRVMERCGFRREGVQRRYYNARGALHDNVLFGLLRDEVTLDLDQLATRFANVGS